MRKDWRNDRDKVCTGEHGRAGNGKVLAPCHETPLLLSCS